MAKSSRRRVGLDVDGVLADLITPCLAVASEMTGKEITPDHMKSWDFDHLVPPEMLEPFWERIGKPGLCGSLVPLDGAVDGVKALSEVADVYIVTSYLRGAAQWVHERDGWLQDHFGIPHARMVYTKAKYTFHGHMLVDDKPDNVSEWADEYSGGASLRVPVLWSQPYNSMTKFPSNIDYRIVRTNDWMKLIDILHSRTYPRTSV
jgi:5'(3')-deoxyribonucleotidase